ncbi:hypothetical protein AAFF_G00088450 [Aldrovandia affinis]|uniref:Radial spoke protein 3 n=1 Tax=Aldrovandia affinis TaxID=143900 RepID=A0AAD7RW98_9TELE|nr:hypothetical protein AAFF_G00088450 [Aldrovandia affinis]
MQTKKEGESTYTFASRPRPLQNRSKYRESVTEPSDGNGSYVNIMYDRRVVRGNTYAQTIIPVPAPKDPIEIQRQQEARRRAIARRRAKMQFRTSTPEAVEGRQHVDIQTELYLEELSDTVEESTVECQTDAFLDKPASPVFIPAKTGRDVGTQIEEGELFDFDLEVRPLLETLVGKTVEQSLQEVMEEEELASLRAQQRAYEELRNLELVEVQRLEKREHRHRQEKERRLRQQREVLRRERETAEKVAARAFSRQYLVDLLPSVYTTLKEHGYFYDPVERDLETVFLPWLMAQANGTLEKHCAARAIVDMLIRDVAQRKSHLYQQMADKSPDPS